MSHWAADYIGKGWAAGAEGPDAFDCWTFLRHVYRAHYSIDLPLIDSTLADNYRATANAIASQPDRGNWTQVVDAPRDGDAVLLAHSRHPTHVGVWLEVDGGGVLHCVHGAGVVFSALSALARGGWGRIEYYRRKETASTSTAGETP